MNVALVTHKPIFTRHARGGERSMRHIVAFLQGRGHTVTVYDETPKNFKSDCNLVFTWGRPAADVTKVAESAGLPLVLFVRFWKNIAPAFPAGGYGDLLRRPVDRTFTDEKEHLFRYASAIVTNSKYAKSVIHRWQPDAVGKTFVSYVPVTGEYNELGTPYGALTVVTPEVYGERDMVRRMAAIDDNLRFHIVNAAGFDSAQFSAISSSVRVSGYVDMREVWPNTAILLNPIYHNDICGTRRTTIEAFRHGIPVIANDRCGISEKVPPAMLVRANAGPAEWKAKVDEILKQYDRFRNLARRAWEQYNTAGELQRIEKIFIECVYS